MCMKMCIHYSIKNLLASYVCLCFLLLLCIKNWAVWLFDFHGDQIFVDFARFVIREVLYTFNV